MFTIISLMKTNKIQQLSFPINNWGHLYSLQKAITHNKQLTGRHLSISGQLLHHPFLDNKNTDIKINFLQTDYSPEYNQVSSGEYILAVMTLSDNMLSADINVDKGVFEELRKNLMEYADIEGIHIMVTIGVVLNDNETWKNDQDLNIIQFDYAMKGDTL